MNNQFVSDIQAPCQLEIKSSALSLVLFIDSLHKKYKNVICRNENSRNIPYNAIRNDL
jgi:hypothetical protein